MHHAQLAPFPSDFLWGASTSAYQVEGGWDADGKGPSVIDAQTHGRAGTTDFTVASDHYHRYVEDVSLFAELGLRAYRFSIAWTRIIPDGDGPVNPAGVGFYHRLIDELLARGHHPDRHDVPLRPAQGAGRPGRVGQPGHHRGVRPIRPRAVRRVRVEGALLADHQRAEHDGPARRRPGPGAPRRRGQARRCTSRTITCCWPRPGRWPCATRCCPRPRSARRRTSCRCTRPPAPRRM